MVGRSVKRSAGNSSRYGPEVARRRSIRLEGYDYALSGAYFVTVCTDRRRSLFGRVSGGRMVENRNARILRACWEALPDHYPRVSLDAFVVMPDHVHGIVVLGDVRPVDVYEAGGAALADAGFRHGVPEIVRALKTFSARRINAARGTPGVPVWQRGYYERIVRDGHALRHIREYIRKNPQKWQPAHPNP